MKVSPHAGFTLLELLVALAVAAILLAVGVPSLVDTMRSSRTSADYNRAVGALFLARSEAVKGTTAVTLCARATDSTCGKDWNDGWLVFTDRAPRAGGATATIGAEDTLLAAESPPHEHNDVSLLVSPGGTAADAVAASWISYLSDGSANVAGASLLVCDERGPLDSRVANVVITGDVRRGRPDGSEEEPRARDAFGRALDCPEPDAA